MIKIISYQKNRTDLIGKFAKYFVCRYNHLFADIINANLSINIASCEVSHIFLMLFHIELQMIAFPPLSCRR